MHFEPEVTPPDLLAEGVMKNLWFFSYFQQKPIFEGTCIWENLFFSDISHCHCQKKTEKQVIVGWFSMSHIQVSENCVVPVLRNIWDSAPHYFVIPTSIGGRNFDVTSSYRGGKQQLRQIGYS